MYQIGMAKFEVLEKEIAFEGKPIRAQETTVGKLTSYKVQTTDLSTIIFGIVTWPDETTEVIPIEFVEGEQKYSKLGTSGRMSLINDGDHWIGELRAMKFNSVSKLFNLATTSYEDLCELAEEDIKTFFYKFGSVEVGTREALHGETNKNKSRLAFKCQAGNKDLVAATYVVTRVLAVLKDYGM